MAMAIAPRIVSPNGTSGTQARLRALDHADSRALGNTYMATGWNIELAPNLSTARVRY